MSCFFALLFSLFFCFFFFFNDTATTEIYTLSLHDALPILRAGVQQHERAEIHVIGERRLPPEVIVHLVPIAVVVVLSLAPKNGVHVPVPSPGRCPLPEHIREHPFVIRSAQDSQVVRLESRAAPVLGCLPKPVSCFLGEARIKAVAVKISAVRVEGRREKTVGGFGAAGTLVIPGAGELGSTNRRRVAADVRDRTLDIEGV